MKAGNNEGKKRHKDITRRKTRGQGSMCTTFCHSEIEGEKQIMSPKERQDKILKNKTK